MDPIIIDHNFERYRDRWKSAGANRFNGAYYYSREIVRNIIPRIETDRNWITLNCYGYAANHAIVFVHNNKHPENYQWLQKYDDLILVCGIRETVDKVRAYGDHVIYLPLSIDTEEIQQYKTIKDKDTAFAGRRGKITSAIPNGTTILQDMPRELLLREIARYKKIYAVGRTAIEARALGCEVLPYDPRYPDPTLWQVIDNRQAAAILQEELDRIEPRPMTDKNKNTNNNEWLEGFPEQNGIYKCLIDNEEIKPLMHKKCSINGKHRWMLLDGHDVLGSVKWKGSRLGIDEL